MEDDIRVRKRSQRIMLKYSSSKFKNTASTPIMIDMDTDEESKPPTVQSDNPEVKSNPRMVDMLVDQKNDSGVLNQNEGVETLMKDLTMNDNDSPDKEEVVHQNFQNHIAINPTTCSKCS
ncbi:hypothetical protein L6452_05961 [Arctium lappa]|uniref:Uncharacterized protein n=1 Tax=Arctium lappa TaxID=4217 RepID=A0ACB9EHW4_ARCLA|nr:hypothetical protein L6452_05961 [Arctium lappa]